MRILLKTTPNTEIVPFNYQQNLTGAFHKWLGENKEHDDVSLYSFSWLENGNAVEKKGLSFKNGSSFFISAYDKELLGKIVTGIFKDPKIAFGLEVRELIMQDDPDLSDPEFFKVASPVFVKQKLENGKTKHFEYTEPEADQIMTETLKVKMQKAGIIDDTVEVAFARDYKGAKVKLIHHKHIKNKANQCPVIIKGTPETKLFAWNVGIGHSTGIGFGAVKL